MSKVQVQGFAAESIGFRWLPHLDVVMIVGAEMIAHLPDVLVLLSTGIAVELLIHLLRSMENTQNQAEAFDFYC